MAGAPLEPWHTRAVRGRTSRPPMPQPGSQLVKHSRSRDLSARQGGSRVPACRARTLAAARHASIAAVIASRDSLTMSVAVAKLCRRCAIVEEETLLSDHWSRHHPRRSYKNHGCRLFFTLPLKISRKSPYGFVRSCSCRWVSIRVPSSLFLAPLSRQPLSRLQPPRPAPSWAASPRGLASAARGCRASLRR